jgi:predicted nucleic acid-binding protein
MPTTLYGEPDLERGPTRTIYLDLCCMTRPFDDQHQARVRLEAEAVLGLVQLARLGELTWIGSEVLDLECSRNPDADRRRKVEALLSVPRSKVIVGLRERQRGRELEALGFRAFDALHIACAESARAEVLLTTDDRLRNQAARLQGKLAVQVENPAKWYSEVIAP